MQNGNGHSRVAIRDFVEGVEAAYLVSFRTFCLIHGFRADGFGLGAAELSRFIGYADVDVYETLVEHRVYGKLTKNDYSEIGDRMQFVGDRSAAWILVMRLNRPTMRPAIIESNIGYLWSRTSHWCKNYGGKFAPRELLGSGVMGMNRALDLYDHAEERPFLPYARWHVDHEIRKQTRSDGASLHVPKTRVAGVEVYEVRIDDENAPDIPNPDGEPKIISRNELMVRTVIARLNDWERKILRLKYGFDGSPKSDADLADILGVKLSYVSSVKRYALDRVKALIEVSKGLRDRDDVPRPLTPPSSPRNRRPTVTVIL